MAILDVLMTGFTGSDEILKMTERSIKSLRDCDGGQDFNIIFMESNPDSTHKYDVDVQIEQFNDLYDCNVITCLDAGGDTCLDYIQFKSPEDATMFMLRWA